MTAPSLAWIPEAARRVTAPDATVAALAAWAGGGDPGAAVSEVLIDRPAALDGVLNGRIAAHDGRPATLSAWYARDRGPLLADAEATLGGWHEFPRPPGGPFEGEFGGVAPPGWRLLGSLHDPPGTPGRRLVEIALVRDGA